jgi:glycosyltransferase involved in cell wall biosynthesis
MVLAFGAAALVPAALATRVARATGGRKPGGPRRILYLGTGQIAQVFPRNGVNLFLERECSDFAGYFEKMWNVHFPAGTRGALDLTPRHHLIDFDLPLPTPVRKLRRTAMALREIAFLAWLVPFTWRQRISVTTATNPYLQGLNAALVGLVLDIPYAVIVTCNYDWFWDALGKQAFPTVFPNRRIEKCIERWVFKRAALVLADRQYYREYAVRNGALPARAVATRVLADHAYEAARPAHAVRERLELGSGPLLTYVGRLEPEKRSMDLVDCLAQVRRRFPSAQLACAGTGSLADAMWERAKFLGVADGLRLLGAMPLADLAELVASSDVIVAAHMGYTLVEAGLAGTPIATYDYDFHGEVLQDDYSGFLVPLGDVAALAERVCKALADPGFAASVGARTRRRLQREHSPAAVVPLYRDAYERVLSGGDAADGSSDGMPESSGLPSGPADACSRG